LIPTLAYKKFHYINPKFLHFAALIFSGGEFLEALLLRISHSFTAISFCSEIAENKWFQISNLILGLQPTTLYDLSAA